MRESHSLEGKESPRIGPWRLTKDIVRQDGVSGLFRSQTGSNIETNLWTQGTDGHLHTRDARLLFLLPGVRSHPTGIDPSRF